MIIVDTSDFVPTTQEHVIAIAHYIHSICDAKEEYKICFDITSEGITYHQINEVNKVIVELIKINHVHYHYRNFFLALGCAPDPINLSYYRQHCARFGWIEINCLFKNSLECTSANNYIRQNKNSGTINNTPRVKGKKFVSLNRHPKWDRLHIVAQLIKRNLLDKGYCSCYLNSDVANNHNNIALTGLHHYLPNTHLETKKIIEDNYKLFPINLDLQNLSSDDVISSMNRVDGTWYYEDSYFGIVTESKFFHDKDPNNAYLSKPSLSGVSLDCYMFTEKTYKFIATKLPFILSGFTGALEVLKRAGYKTFHPYINESYDSIENDEERLMAICDEIERLCSKTDDEFLEWQTALQPIIDHNFNLLKEQRNIHFIYRIN
jgi:hypothetical protein